MCDPISLTAAGLGLGLVSTGASYMGQQQAIKAQQEAANQYQDQQAQALNAATQKQAQIDQQRQNVMAQSYNNFDPTQQQQQTQQTQQNLFNNYSQGMQGIAPVNIPGANEVDQNTPGAQTVNDAYKNSLNQLGTYLQGQASARAGLDAFGNQNVNNNLYNVRQGQQLEMLNNFAGGNNNTYGVQVGANNLNYETAKANAGLAGSGLSTLGSIGQGLGSALGSIGGAWGYNSLAGAKPTSLPLPSGSVSTSSPVSSYGY